MDTLQYVDALFEEIKKLPPLNAEQQEKLDWKIKLEFHYNTNHIEGNTLTYSETELLFLHDETRGNHTLRELEEMKASVVALHLIKELAIDKEQPLTEAFIKYLNGILLKTPYWKEAITPEGQPTRRQIKIGDYKEQPNSVRLQSGVMFHYASPAETPIQMGELIEWYRSEEGTIHPITLAAMLHYRFVRIHPFDDGNGRISRLLMNYVLLRAGYPLTIIKSADKKDYISALRDADVGNYESFIQFVAAQVEWSLDMWKKVANGEDLEERDDWKKEATLLAKSLHDESEAYQEISETVLDNLFQNRIKPFYNSIKSSLSILEELFIKVEESSDLSNTFHPVHDFKLLDYGDDNAPVEVYPDTYNYWLNFKGYKKRGSDHFDVLLRFIWNFDKYSYTCEYYSPTAKDRLSSREHFYHEDLTPAEKAEIISESGKWVLAEIKKHLQQA